MEGTDTEGNRMSAIKTKAEKPESEFNLIYVTAFAVFLVAAAVGKLIPKRWRWNVSGHDEGKSIVAAAKAAACTTIPFAFM
jgi:hypothetical protein